MDFVGTPVSGLPWVVFFFTVSFSHCLVSALKFHSHARLMLDYWSSIFSRNLWLNEIQNTCENGEKTNILGGSSLIDRNLNLHVVFHIFFATTNIGKKSAWKRFLSHGFLSRSWFWKSPNLQNPKHRCRWPMSLLQNQEHSIWTEKTVRSLDVFWVSFGLLDGYNKGW